MNQSSLVATVVLFFCLTTLRAQSKEVIEGQWQDTAHPEKIVEVYAKNGRYYGKDLDDPSRLIFRDLQWNSVARTYSGFVINPKNGDELEVNIEMVDQNNFQFTVSLFIFKKTFRFRRI
jgi:hypothetical protein